MKIRSALTTAAVSLALAGLAGCGNDADDSNTNTSRAPDSTITTPPPATTTPPADSTASTPPAGGSTATAPSTSTSPSTGATSGTDRTAGQTVDDATVTAKVKAALMAESGVDGSKINVDTNNGTVTLKGEVADKSMIDRAVQVAKGVDGVKDVDNKLTEGAG